VTAALVGLAGAPAAAQTFPAASAYAPFHCGPTVMTDAAKDTPGATGALDLVGSAPDQTVSARTGDANFLYLRVRLSDDPRVNNNLLMPNAWGWEFDTDGDLTTYERLISVGGIGGADAVEVWSNSATTVANSAADPADAPPDFVYSGANRHVVAAGTSLGGGTDYFLDVAVPWSDLAKVGITPASRVHVWVGSSTTDRDLDLDLACFGGAGGTLSGIDTSGDIDFTVPNGTIPGGGGGGTNGGGGNQARTLEGGLGCDVGAGRGVGLGVTPMPLAALLLLAWLGRRQRR
jgi:hypothetical protein